LAQIPIAHDSSLHGFAVQLLDTWLRQKSSGLGLVQLTTMPTLDSVLGASLVMLAIKLAQKSAQPVLAATLTPIQLTCVGALMIVHEMSTIGESFCETSKQSLLAEHTQQLLQKIPSKS